MRWSAGFFSSPWLLPAKLYLAGLESTISGDELYTMAITGRSVAQIVDLTRVDSHPPGYFLALKAWEEIPTRLGLASGLLWARSINILGWLLVSGVAWWGGRRLLGRSAGTALAWCVTATAFAAKTSMDLRGHSFVFPAVTIAFLLLLLADCGEHSRRWSDVALWASYACCLIVALWSHPLSGLLVFFLGLGWLILAIGRRSFRPTFVWMGGLAHGLALISFLPWALLLMGQWRTFERIIFDSNAPATLANLARVFVVWFPLGAVRPDRFGPLALVSLLLGVLAVMVPVGLGAVAACRGVRRRSTTFPPAVAMLGLALPAAFVTALWLAERLDMGQVFHRPRYTDLAVGIWAIGLVALGGWSLRELRVPASVIWWVVAPWMLASAEGHRIYIRDALSLESVTDDPAVAGLLPAASGDLYVMPEEMIHYFARSFGDYRVHGAEDLRLIAEGVTEAAVVNLNAWPTLERPRDLLLRSWIETDRLSRSVEVRGDPMGRPTVRAYRLSGLLGTGFGTLPVAGESTVGRAVPPSSVAVALPEGQLFADNWSFLEPTGDTGAFIRWARGPRTTLRFDRPLAPGRFRVMIRGYRTERPARSVEMRLRFGGDEDWQASESIAAGEFLLSQRLELIRTEDPLRVDVHHPSWSPGEQGGPDRRQLAFALRYAWVEEVGVEAGSDL